MRGRVLVVYATGNGSTAQIAGAIADVLRTAGLEAEPRLARFVASVAPYDAVVLGSGLYAGHWQRDARRFVRRHRHQLADRPLWLFSSGPLDTTASQGDIPPTPAVLRLVQGLGAREHVTFGGCLRQDASSRGARMLLRSGRPGDFRDFPVIEAWAARVAAQLLAEPEHAQ
ncbi:flavodoxin [Streptomyces sp. SID14478]|uniref:flavodoxin domain-containing protein n=1 Tax=Streptomyces sp. SID14478 TaxID=2706073 RepID=UPI0013D99ECF|nr:flavodoxin domain-containing protein [Streptomyces sp. SID14478]NEB74245.1 flavodoxin [Streptomyces sp. SID14478]